MKAKIKYINKYIFGHFTGITLGPYIWVSLLSSNPVRTANHERIHLAQIMELVRKVKKIVRLKPVANVIGIIWFYTRYGLNYARNVFKYGKAAYRNLYYEREAYDNDDNLAYLDDRKDGAHNDYRDGS